MNTASKLLIAATLALTAGSTFAADGREDAHCSAIFVAASEYFQVKADEKHEEIEDAFRAAKQLDLHKSLTKIFEWERKRVDINRDAYLDQVEFYYDKLDTPTALLHYDRCFRRGLAIYTEYRKDVSNQ